MPRIPTYQSQLGAARSTTATIESSLTYMPWVKATQHTGAMLEARGAQLLQEYDQTRAYNAFNELRDQSRGKVEELLQREGAQAQGVQAEYEEWTKQAQSDVSKNSLSTFSQTEMFSKLAEQRRAGDLDRLAGHEVTQHKIYKGEVIKGLANVTERDIRTSAFDDAKMDGMIGNYFTAVDGLFPGHDTSTDKIAALQTFRVSAMDELINSNPKYAAGKLEEWKGDLGEKYTGLKKRLEAQTTDNKMSEAYNTVFTKYKTNFEGALSFLAVPANQEKLGLDFKEVGQLHGRFSALLSDRERSERIGRDNLEQDQKINAGKVLQSLYNPAAPKVDYNELHRTRKIDNATYQHAINAKESTVIDNPFTVTDLHDQIERGVDVTDSIRSAIESGSLSEKSASAIGKHQTDERSKRAMQYIDRALRPSDADKWSPDKHLKYADATRLYYAKVTSGMDYEQAAFEVVKGYINDVRRTWRGLPTPEGLQGEQKKDPASLEKAKTVLVEKFRSGQITPTEYKERMKNIDSLIKLADEDSQAEAMDTEIEALRKKKLGQK
jgi:hypothetical protein